MKLSEMMASITPSGSYKGIQLPDKTVVAINPSKKGTKPIDEFVVFRELIENISPTYSSETEEKNYYYDGKSTVKTGVSVELPISGQRYEGDAAQDLMVENVFSIGEEAIFEVVWFNLNTGKGRVGTFTIDPTQFEGGEAGDPGSPFELTLLKTGIQPVKFNYSTDKTKTFDEIVNPSEL